jgi:YVTN family beta-propeller protein
VLKQGNWIFEPPFAVLNHNSNDSAPKPTYDGGIFKNTPAGRSPIGRRYGLDFGALTAGVTVSADGKQIYAVNMEDDSVSVVDASSRKVLFDLKLFTPGSRVPKGEYPYWVSAHGTANGETDKLFISSIRDGQVVSLAKTGRQNVIDLGGEPGKMLMSRDGSRLYVANTNRDEIDEIDTGSERLMRRISVLRPGYRYHGANPNSLALTSKGRTLYVTLGGENSVAVIDVASGMVAGRIPTGWYPTSVTLSNDDSRLFIANRKANTGPDPDGGLASLYGGFALPPPYGVHSNTDFKNEYVECLEKAGLLTVPVPDSQTLAYLSAVVDANNNYSASAVHPSAMMQYLHQKIKHVIYIMKENRAYDQMLGDLPVGNGEPRLVMYPQPVTPNFHSLALRFADLDNFYVPSQSSGDGWEWTWQGHVNDFSELTESYYFSGQGPSGAMDFAPFFGSPRLINLALPLRSAHPDQFTQRITTLLDPTGASTVLPGTKDLVSTEGADDDRPDRTGGYIWDTALRAGLSVRHYGIWDDQFFYYNYNGYTPNAPGLLPIVRDAAAKHVIQGVPTHPALVGRTDPYFRGWDLNEPDEYRYEEWKREFDQFVRNGNLPNLEIMTLMMDHTGNFATNVAHLTTPTLDEADNDHAIGLLVHAVSHSPYWKDTAIFIVEDDSVDGPDHVDAHRSPAYVISPWVATNAVVHTFCNTDSIIRTIEDLLGVNYLGFNDATASSMDDVFSTRPNLQPYDVIIPGVLCSPPVDPKLVPDCYNPAVKKTRFVASLHDGQWWIEQTKNLVFDRPDANDPVAYNRLLWRGVMAATTYRIRPSRGCNRPGSPGPPPIPATRGAGQS